jgi:hypothetical protein
LRGVNSPPDLQDGQILAVDGPKPARKNDHTLFIRNDADGFPRMTQIDANCFGVAAVVTPLASRLTTTATVLIITE